MECTVKLEVFEGPLDLLLHLIKKNEIDIHDLPMAIITRQYLEYLSWMKRLNLDLASDYLVMAATLVHIKSRMLLPASPEAGEEESQDLEDPRAELVRRLLEYQRYREAADHLGARLVLDRDVFSRPSERAASVEDGEEPAWIEEANLFDLVEAFHRVLASRRLNDASLDVELERVSLADRIQQIAEILEGHPQGLGFEDLFPPHSSKRDLIITFLALLEMIRLRMIRAFQASAYGTLRIVPV